MTAATPLDVQRDSGWLVVCTKPNQEEVAVENIERQELEAYCPMILRRRSHARRVEMVRRPLFPSYAFVRLPAEKPQWRSLLATRGVLTVVRFNNQPGFMPRGLVEQLRSYEQRNLLQRMTISTFEPGTQVRVKDGPFHDYIAEVLSADERGRIWLLLEIMGQTVRLQCDAMSVER